MTVFSRALMTSARPLLALGLLALAAEGAAQPPGAPIGFITNLQGETTFTSRGHTAAAAVGQAVVVGATLRTGADGAMGVILNDDSVLSFGPGSEIIFDEFQFEPAREALKLSARMNRGTFNFISGVIGRLAPDAVELKVPAGTLGVHGSHVLVKIDG
jgi:hypothetical protein